MFRQFSAKATQKLNIDFRYGQKSCFEMTNKTCASGVCKSDSRHDANIKFAKFVQPGVDRNRAIRWAHLMGRAAFGVDDIRKWTFVCEKHFPENVELNYHQVNDCVYQ